MDDLGLQPSFVNGYAKNASESENPELWEKLILASAPSLGSQGSKLIDFSGNKRHGTLVNMDLQAVWSPGEKGLYLDFDNVDDQVSVGSGLAGKDTMSINAWIYPKSTSAGPIITIVTSGSNSAGMFISWQGSPINGFRIVGSVRMDNVTAMVTAPVPPLNAWSNINFKWSFLLGTAVLHVNGILSGSVAITTQWVGAGSRSYIGSGDWGNGSFNGGIGNILVYETYLNALKMDKLYLDSAAIFRLRRSDLISVNGAAESPISKTVSSAYESLSSVKDTKISAIETQSAVSGSGSASIEALKGTEQTFTTAIESLSDVSKTVQAAYETLSGETLVSKMVTSAYESSFSEEVTKGGVIEAQGFVSRPELASIESLQEAEQTFTTAIESLSDVSKTAQAAYEAITGETIVSKTLTSAYESSFSEEVTKGGVIEAQGFVCRPELSLIESLLGAEQTFSAAIESLAGVSKTVQAAFEALGTETAVSKTVQAVFEVLSFVEITKASDFEALESIQRTAFAASESKGHITTSKLGAIESRQIIAKISQTEYEYLKAVSRAAGTSIESLLGIESPARSDYEARLGVQLMDLTFEIGAIFAPEIEVIAEF